MHLAKGAVLRLFGECVTQSVKKTMQRTSEGMPWMGAGNSCPVERRGPRLHLHAQLAVAIGIFTEGMRKLSGGTKKNKFLLGQYEPCNLIKIL
ncbi:hypothetical protein CsSME_00053563 [Camellia sinensis var. sinensis]